MAQRRIVFWDTRRTDGASQTAWSPLVAALARDGYQVVVAAHLEPSGRSVDVAHLDMPPGPDDLPAALLTDPDPAASLAACGVTGSELLVADMREHGLPGGFTHALTRLRALAWVSGWMAHWLDAIEPDVLVLMEPRADAATVLVESMARARCIRVATAIDAVEVARLAPARHAPGRRVIGDACRSANDRMAAVRPDG